MFDVRVRTIPYINGGSTKLRLNCVIERIVDGDYLFDGDYGLLVDC